MVIKKQSHVTNHVISTTYYFICVMLTSDVKTVDLRHAVKKIAGKKLGIIDQPRFHADMQSTS